MTAYHRPASLDQALSLLAAGRLRVLAGGTDLYPGAGVALAGDIVDLAGLPELTAITLDDLELRLGSALTWGQIARARLPPALAALQQAALQVGGRQIHNTGTIGGNLCNASPAADGVPPLLILDAQVEIASVAGMRRMPLADFLTGPRRTALQAGEVLVAVIFPKSALSGASAFEKLGARTHLVISIAMVAARVVVHGGRVTEAAVAIGACSGTAQRVPLVERAVRGAAVATVSDRVRPQDVAAAISPIDDVRATADYRILAAVELVRRALLRAAERASEVSR